MQPTALLDLREHIRRKLVGGIISLLRRVTETHITIAHRKHDLAVGFRQCDDGVALMGIDVEMVCRREVIYRWVLRESCRARQQIVLLSGSARGVQDVAHF